ncbi:MAG TPA: LPP20 family lipoprotein [Gammaproteobacteria bacterium]
MYKAMTLEKSLFNAGALLSCIVFFLLLLSACGANPSANSAPENDIPSWIFNPTSTDGSLVAAGCTDWTDNLSLDKKIALAKARSDLAQQIKIRIKGVDTLYAKKENNNAPQNVFESVSEQITDSTLQDVKVEKLETVNLQGRKQLCTLLRLSKEQGQTMFRSLVKATALTINAEEEAKLYNQFTAF